MPDANNLVWIDLEMSGLDLEHCRILEIATLVTDGQLNVLAEGPCLVIHQPDAVLNAMDEWNTSHHGASGLTAKVKESAVSVEAAEAQTLAFIAEWLPKGKGVLCGNSIGTDRRFIDRYMPALGGFLHYRSVDVSSFKEVLRRWVGEEAVPPKKNCHRALDDIKESIAELRHYRAHYFKI